MRIEWRWLFGRLVWNASVKELPPMTTTTTKRRNRKLTSFPIQFEAFSSSVSLLTNLLLLCWILPRVDNDMLLSAIVPHELLSLWFVWFDRHEKSPMESTFLGSAMFAPKSKLFHSNDNGQTFQKLPPKRPVELWIHLSSQTNVNASTTNQLQSIILHPPRFDSQINNSGVRVCHKFEFELHSNVNSLREIQPTQSAIELLWRQHPTEARSTSRESADRSAVHSKREILLPTTDAPSIRNPERELGTQKSCSTEKRHGERQARESQPKIPNRGKILFFGRSNQTIPQQQLQAHCIFKTLGTTTLASERLV